MALCIKPTSKLKFIIITYRYNGLDNLLTNNCKIIESQNLPTNLLIDDKVQTNLISTYIFKHHQMSKLGQMVYLGHHSTSQAIMSQNKTCNLCIRCCILRTYCFVQMLNLLVSPPNLLCMSKHNLMKKLGREQNSFSTLNLFIALTKVCELDSLSTSTNKCKLVSSKFSILPCIFITQLLPCYDVTNCHVSNPNL